MVIKNKIKKEQKEMTNFINLATIFTTALALTASSVPATTVYVDKSIDTTEELVVEYDYGVVDVVDDDEIISEDKFVFPDVDTENKYVESETESVYDEDFYGSIEYGYVTFNEEEPIEENEEEFYKEDVDNNEEEWYDDYEDEEESNDESNEELINLDYALEHLDEFEHWETVNENDETELHIIIDNEEYVVVYSYESGEDVLPIENTNGFVSPIDDSGDDWIGSEIIGAVGTIDEFIGN
jgi:hypothetical protein